MSLSLLASTTLAGSPDRYVPPHAKHLVPPDANSRRSSASSSRLSLTDSEDEEGSELYGEFTASQIGVALNSTAFRAAWDTPGTLFTRAHGVAKYPVKKNAHAGRDHDPVMCPFCDESVEAQKQKLTEKKRKQKEKEKKEKKKKRGGFKNWVKQSLSCSSKEILDDDAKCEILNNYAKAQKGPVYKTGKIKSRPTSSPRAPPPSPASKAHSIVSEVGRFHVKENTEGQLFKSDTPCDGAATAAINRSTTFASRRQSQIQSSEGDEWIRMPPPVGEGLGRILASQSARYSFENVLDMVLDFENLRIRRQSNRMSVEVALADEHAI